ncbi:MAG: hypothetical protein ABIH23_00470 [bacterium]
MDRVVGVMDTQSPKQPNDDRTIHHCIILGLLVLVFFPLLFPRIVTTSSEDVLMLLFFGACAVSWRRGWPFPSGLRLIVDFIGFGFLFIVVWRNQLDLISDWGRLIYWPMVCLVALACLAGGAERSKNATLRLLSFALLVSLVGLTLSQVFLPTTLPVLPDRYQAQLLVPKAISILGLFTLFLLIRSDRYVSRRNLYIAAPILFGLLVGVRGCYRDGQVLVTWWKAGRLERSVRSWIGEENQTARRTRRVYSQILNTLDERGGDLTRSCGLNFLVRYRIAETAKRMHHPARMLSAVALGLPTTRGQSLLLADLWTVSEMENLRRRVEDPRFLLSLRTHSLIRPDIRRSRSVWSDLEEEEEHWEYCLDLYVDHEISPDGSEAWLLDRWGRVFKAQGESSLEPVWESAPKEGRSNAVDLEIWGDTLVVAFADGDVRLHGESPAWFNRPWPISLSPGERIVDIELHPSGQGAVALSSLGEFFVMGTVPEEFPIPEDPLFYEDVAEDLEISSDCLGWYVLDSRGAIHAASGGNRFPMAVNVPDSEYWAVKTRNAPYWYEDMALDIEIDPLGRGIGLLNKLGEVWVIADPSAFRLNWPFEGEEDTLGLGVSLAIQQDGAVTALFAPGNTKTQAFPQLELTPSD